MIVTFFIVSKMKTSLFQICMSVFEVVYSPISTQHSICSTITLIREQFSVGEFSHSVVSVCQTFGQFVEFIVVVSEVEEELASKRYRLDASDNEPICLKVPSLISKEKIGKMVYTMT